MPDEEKQETATPPSSTSSSQHNDSQDGEEISLVDELGIIDESEPVFGGRGRLFSAAGRYSPLAEFTDEELIMHPPQLPFQEDGPVEKIELRTNDRGVLLDELGVAKHVAGARYKGQVLWVLGEQFPETSKNLIAWFDREGNPHRLYVNEEPLTVDVVFRLRNKTHDGELSFFADITTD